MFRTALHSVSYAGVWPGQVCLPITRVIEKAAEMGFDAIMLMAKRPHGSLLELDADGRAGLRRCLDDHGVGLAALAAYNDFGAGLDRPDVPFVEIQAHYLGEMARLAADLGGNLVRVFTSFEPIGAGYNQLWCRTVEGLRASGDRAAEVGVTLGVQNHHDLAVHYLSLRDLLREVDHPNVKACFDAWAVALHGDDVGEAARALAEWTVHTTIADYVRRPRYRYQPNLVNYERQDDVVRAVPIGEGFIDYRRFLSVLKELGYGGYVAYEMCSPLEGGGSEANLDRAARRFLEYVKALG
jgi:sugar phosphate isomerase/epimerase